MGETCQALLMELWKCRGFNRKTLCLRILLEGVEGLEMPAWMLHTVDPTERKIFCSTRSLSSNYPGSWRGQAWKSGLQEGFSAFSPDISAMGVNKQPCSLQPKSTLFVCVYGTHANKYIWYVYGVCHMCYMPHMWDFKISPYIYLHSLTFIFFPTHSDGSFWKMKNYVCPFHWIQIQMLDSEKEVFIKNKTKKGYFPKFSDRK